jgi:hypothetical protein
MMQDLIHSFEVSEKDHLPAGTVPLRSVKFR